MVRLLSKDQEERHGIQLAEGLTLAVELGWIGTRKVKSKRSAKLSLYPLLETVSSNFPFSAVKITARTLGNTWPQDLE